MSVIDFWEYRKFWLTRSVKKINNTFSLEIWTKIDESFLKKYWFSIIWSPKTIQDWNKTYTLKTGHCYNDKLWILFYIDGNNVIITRDSAYSLDRADKFPIYTQSTFDFQTIISAFSNLVNRLLQR